MFEFLGQFQDVDFLQFLAEMSPFVGAGFLIATICAIVGWVWGFVLRIARVES